MSETPSPRTLLAVRFVGSLPVAVAVAAVAAGPYIRDFLRDGRVAEAAAVVLALLAVTVAAAAWVGFTLDVRARLSRALADNDSLRRRVAALEAGTGRRNEAFPTRPEPPRTVEYVRGTGRPLI